MCHRRYTSVEVGEVASYNGELKRLERHLCVKKSLRDGRVWLLSRTTPLFLVQLVRTLAGWVEERR